MGKPSEPRNHHLIPRFYLAGFTSEERRGATLVETDLSTASQARVLPEKTAARRDFYRVDAPGLDPSEAERLLKMVEDEAARVIKTISSSKRFPEKADLQVLLEFAALMAARVEASAEMVEGMLWFIHNGVMDHLLSSKEAWGDAMRLAQAKGAKLPAVVQDVDASYEIVRNAVKSGAITTSLRDGWFVPHMFQMWDVILPWLERRGWMLVRTDKERGEFIVSDRPVALTFVGAADNNRQPPGFGLKNTRVFFPLNRRYAFVGDFAWTDGVVVEADSETVAYINGRQLRFHRKLVYSARTDFEIISVGGRRFTSAQVIEGAAFLASTRSGK